jgi:hypothetical protein
MDIRRLKEAVNFARSTAGYSFLDGARNENILELKQPPRKEISTV